MGIDLGDIQGNILRPYAMMEARFAFVHFDEPAAGRAWLAALVDQVTSAQPWADSQKPATLNLAFTSAGLQALGLGPGTGATFSPGFRSGMAAHADQLGDTGTNAPQTWESWWRD